MINKAMHAYKDLNMRYKLFIQYLLLISIPFIIFILVNNHLTSKDLEKQAQYSSRQVFEQSRSYLEYKIENVNTYMTIVSLNDKIQEILKKDPKDYEDNYGLWGFDLNDMRKQAYISRPIQDITQTIFYVKGSVTGLSEADDFQKISNIVSTNWYRKLVSGSNTFEWFHSEDNYISVVKKIPNNQSLQESIGVMRVDMPEDVFTAFLDHVAFFKSSSAFLINQNNEILTKSTNAQVSHSASIADIIRHNGSNSLESGVWDKFTLNQEKFLIGIQSVAGANAYLAVLVPYNEILASQSKAIRQMLLITLFIMPFALPLAFIGASSGTKRIRKLINQMKNVKKGEFDVQLHPGGKDEIGELTHNFNSMMTKISLLLDEKYELGKEITSLELKALQTQINPHFLYNTLDLMYWKAVEIEESSIYELVQSLSKFYKLSLSKGSSIVTLKNEIEHIQAYVDIQNARFDYGITLILNIPDSLYTYMLPKITLQPIIENSIIHGILETENEIGTITIRGYIHEDQFILELHDDGVGIPEDKINSILTISSGDDFHGYGLYNINKRIKLLYGDAYGLTYGTHNGTGTTVCIVLPVQSSILQD